MVFLAFNHARDKDLILSNNLGTSGITLLNRRLMRSFHKTQAEKSQISCINKHLVLPPLGIWVNWTKWWATLLVSTPTKPIQWRSCYHKETQEEHDMNKWSAVSAWTHPATKRAASVCKIPLPAKFGFAGKQFRKRRHAKIDTFNGTWWCHTRSKAISNWEKCQKRLKNHKHLKQSSPPQGQEATPKH